MLYSSSAWRCARAVVCVWYDKGLFCEHWRDFKREKTCSCGIILAVVDRVDLLSSRTVLRELEL